MNNKFWNIRPVVVLLLVVSAVFVAATAFWNATLFYIELTLWAAMAVFSLWYLLTNQKRVNRLMKRLVRRLNVKDKEALSSLPVAAVCVSGTGEIVWFNRRFSKDVPGSEEALGRSVETILGATAFQELRDNLQANVRLQDRQYTVSLDVVEEGDQLGYVLYYWDDTTLKLTAEEYANSRPVVLIVMIDNLEELSQNVRDSERARISGQIEKLLEDWIGTTNGIIRKYDAYRFMAVVEHRDLQRMIAEKFSILQTVRELEYDGISGITLSVGVGAGEDFKASELQARQAVEMALGRGGDQVALRTESGYDFYGGRSQGTERRTKVRTRVVARAISDLLDAGDTVLVMGHRYSDLDSLGSGMALTRALRQRGQNAYMIVNKQTTLAPELVERYEQAGCGYMLLDEEAAKDHIDEHTVLIITDTHSPKLIESEEIYRAVPQVIVIDHHRKAVNYIDNAVIFYHEPTASSASEMVAELLPYLLDNRPLEKLDAEALLAGIMLDTRGFVMKAGARTFEAAAYLRRCGADTISVKKLSAVSIEQYYMKSEIIAHATPYRNTVIATCAQPGSPMVRVAAAQAADELLSVRETDASFALFIDGDKVYISARSYGRFNVQLVMETLGGGGHMTMAAAQVPGTDMDAVVARLKEEIDRQLADM
ncbi:MAG: DHH family phosphoesterase [Clostridia bacterium]|nr:DHH family phosphoesterase [Clostridia bacterium]